MSKLKFTLLLLLFLTITISSHANHVPWGHTSQVNSIPSVATGNFSVIRDTTIVHGSGTIHEFYVEQEIGLRPNPESFAKLVEKALLSDKGWKSVPGIGLQRVNTKNEADFGVTLASPETTDRLCKPLQTNGIYSCWNGRRAVINFWRWHAGSRGFKSLRNYRLYVINHEVGHALGYDHLECTNPGDTASVMIPQSKSLEGCDSNPWPRPLELSSESS